MPTLFFLHAFYQKTLLQMLSIKLFSEIHLKLIVLKLPMNEEGLYQVPIQSNGFALELW